MQNLPLWLPQISSYSPSSTHFMMKLLLSQELSKLSLRQFPTLDNQNSVMREVSFQNMRTLATGWLRLMENVDESSDYHLVSTIVKDSNLRIS